MNTKVRFTDQCGELVTLSCDGQNDEVQVQAAIDNLPEIGGTIYLSSGKFYFSEPVQKDLIHKLKIQGDWATVIESTDDNLGGNIFQFGDGVDTCSELYLTGFNISSDGLKTGGVGIKFNKCFKVWVVDVPIDYQYRAIELVNTTQVFLTRLPIRNTKENGVTIDSALNSGFDFYLTDLVMDNPDIGGGNIGAGVAWYGGENVQMKGGDILRFVTGLEVVAANGKESRWGKFDMAQFDTCSDNGVHIGNSGTGNVAGLTFGKCWTGSNSNFGVLIDKNGSGYVEGIEFADHDTMNNGLAGIRLAGGEKVDIKGGRAISNSATTHETRSGVEIYEDVSNFSIDGLRAGNGCGHGDSQKNGVNIDDGDSDHLKVINCDLNDNTNLPIYDGSTGTDKVIENNLPV